MTPARPATDRELREGAREAAASTPDLESPAVHVAWQRVMDQVQAVGKTGHNKQQDYNFRGVDAVVNAVGPALRTHGVAVVPSLKRIEYRDVEVGKNRTLMTSCRVEVVYAVVGPRGDVFVHPSEPDFGRVPAEAMDSGDKATSKAMSVAERTFLIQALMLPTHQPDPDEQTYERSAAREPAWNAATAKGLLLSWTEGDKQLAKQAWDEACAGAGDAEELRAAFDAWVNQPKDDEPAGDE